MSRPHSQKLSVRLRDDRQKAVVDTLRPLNAYLSFLYLFITIGHWLVLTPAQAGVMIPLSLASAAIFGLLYAGLRRNGRQPKYSLALSVAVTGMVMLNCVAHIVVTDNPKETLNFALAIVGFGCVFLQMRRYAAAILLALVGWSAALVVSSLPAGDWTQHTFVLISAVVISASIFGSRRYVHRRAFVERVRSQHREAMLKKKLLRSENYDEVTRLPNRRLFLRRLSVAADRSHDLTVIAIRLENLGSMNDRADRSNTHQVLTTVARRLWTVRPTDTTIARVADDTFAVLLEKTTERTQLLATIDEIRSIVREPISLGRQEFSIIANVGVATSERMANDPSRLLSEAILALEDAQKSRPWGVAFFDKAKGRLIRRDRLVAQTLPGAAARNEFRLEFQPKVALAGAQVAGVEALLRWRGADGREVGPADFIPAAEHSGEIAEIGHWVLTKAAETCVWWDEHEAPPLTVAVNVSGLQMAQAGFAELVDRTLRDVGVAAERIELELTESVYLEANQIVESNLRDLAALGVGLAVDDFGTGYSSLSILQEYSFDRLKLDRSLLTAIRGGGRAEKLLSGVIGLAHQIGLEVTAEGVETSQELEFLISCGCDEAQGYLFGAGMSAEALLEWLHRRTETRAVELVKLSSP